MTDLQHSLRSDNLNSRRINSDSPTSAIVNAATVSIILEIEVAHCVDNNAGLASDELKRTGLHLLRRHFEVSDERSVVTSKRAARIEFLPTVHPKHFSTHVYASWYALEVSAPVKISDEAE